MTEKELLEDQPKKLYKLSSLINKGVVSFDDVAEIIPGIMHVNSRTDLGIEYMPQSGADLIRYSVEEIISQGAELLHRHQSDYTLNVVYPKLFSEIEKNDKDLVIPFFQDWKYNKDERHVLHFTSTKILNKDQLISISLFPNQISELSETVNKLFGIDVVFSKYFTRYNTLTKREKEILMLLSQELTRKELSYALHLSEFTIKKHCENIYKKLGVSKRTEIEKIALAFSSL